MVDYINRFFGLFFRMFRRERHCPHHPKTAAISHPSSRYATPSGSACNLDHGTKKQSFIKRPSSMPSVSRQSQMLRRSSSQISLLHDSSPARNISRCNAFSAEDASQPFVRRLPPGTPSAHNKVPKFSRSAEQGFENRNFALKSSHSFETCSVVDGFDDMPLGCGRMPRPKRQFQPRIQHFPHLGYHFNCHSKATSRIPLRKFGDKNPPVSQNKEFNKLLQQHARKYSGHGKPNGSVDTEIEPIGDGPRVGKGDVSNWITFRHDTNTKFEQTFKILSMKRHTIGNLIDSKTHKQWMLACRIDIDREATLFKRFAGGKVVLSIGEYKFFLQQICTTHEIDYWDVLRKMATFSYE